MFNFLKRKNYIVWVLRQGYLINGRVTHDRKSAERFTKKEGEKVAKFLRMSGITAQCIER
jgi:DNA-binding winged helix-turn-helix (wHTH) protein